MEKNKYKTLKGLIRQQRFQDMWNCIFFYLFAFFIGVGGGVIFLRKKEKKTFKIFSHLLDIFSPTAYFD